MTPPADPEFWKNLYGHEWESASKAVIALHEKIVRKYPDLEDSVKFGLGATTGKKIKVPPGQKHEADITYYYDYELLCHIQVSAPQKGRVPPGDIWVLKGKYELAATKELAGEKTWFYFEYPLTGNTYALDIPMVKPFEKNVEMMYLQKDASGRRIPEPYIKIPFQKASSSNALLDWIGQELIPRRKP